VLTEVMFFSDGSSALLQTASKGKTVKKKTKGEEGTMIHSLDDYCYVTTSREK